MAIESEALFRARETITGNDYVEAIGKSPFTVYIGVYNATLFLPTILDQILGQKLQDFPLIVVDNRSTDASWSQIREWPEAVLARTKLIRNPINLGGVGSMTLNLSEVKTEWIIAWHQDDSYKRNHLEVLAEAIASSSIEDIVVFTDMGTQNSEGKEVFTPIRQSWTADLSSPQTTFRANLLQQSVSYPSAAFRVSGLAPARIPWHSSSFPDTEITLLQASMGRSKFVPELTMLYRMNPQSESHDLNPKERVLGPFSSLSRVMASDSFFRLCDSVPNHERESFAKAVLEGIDIRLGQSPFSELVKLIAAETMGSAWVYSEKNSREQILETYRIAEDGRTAKLLKDLGAFYSGGNSTSTDVKQNQQSTSQIKLEKMLKETMPPSNIEGGTLLKTVLRVFGSVFPLPIRRKVVAFLVRLYSLVKPKSPWNLAWKPKS
jgi:glycosyltransferase involved in cell wall biosynthesis